MKSNRTKLMVTLLFLMLIILPVNALLGTYKQNEAVDLIQTCNNCTYCNISSVKYPNGTNIFTNEEMTEDKTYYNFTLNNSYTSTTGKYKYCYDCGNAIEKATGCIDFDITVSGNETPEGVSYLILGIILLFFGIASGCLYLSKTMEITGFKIFFLLMSFIFILGCLATSSIAATDSNLTAGINKSVSVMLFAVGLITFVMFAYVLIEQIINILDMMAERKGFEPT